MRSKSVFSRGTDELNNKKLSTGTVSENRIAYFMDDCAGCLWRNYTSDRIINDQINYARSWISLYGPRVGRQLAKLRNFGFVFHF